MAEKVNQEGDQVATSTDCNNTMIAAQGRDIRPAPDSGSGLGACVKHASQKKGNQTTKRRTPARGETQQTSPQDAAMGEGTGDKVTVLGKGGNREDAGEERNGEGAEETEGEQKKKVRGKDSIAVETKDVSGGMEATGQGAAGLLMGANGGARQGP